MRQAALLALLAGSAGAVAAQNGSHPVPLSERFPVGEKFIYDGRLGFARVGMASLSVESIDTIRGTPSLHVQVVVQTSTAIYRLNNVMDSWFGLDDFASRRFVQDFHEGSSKRYTAYDIFPDSGFYRQTGVDTARTASPDPLDDAAFFWFARTVDLIPGKRYEFTRYFRPDRNPVVLEVVERDTIDVPAGRFPVVLVHPIIKGGGILREQSNARIWISDDDRRLIVQMKTKLLGNLDITLRLAKVEGRRDTPSR